MRKREEEKGEKNSLCLWKEDGKDLHITICKALPLDRGRQIFTNYNDENKNCNNLTTTSKRTTAVITPTKIVGYD